MTAKDGEYVEFSSVTSCVGPVSPACRLVNVFQSGTPESLDFHCAQKTYTHKPTHTYTSWLQSSIWEVIINDRPLTGHLPDDRNPGDAAAFVKDRMEEVLHRGRKNLVVVRTATKKLHDFESSLCLLILFISFISNIAYGMSFAFSRISLVFLPSAPFLL